MTMLRGEGKFRSSEKVILLMMACALTCVLLSILFGALGALYYIPQVSAWMGKAGVSLVQLRPLHTTFASAWIFLGAVACVYKYLFDTFGEPDSGDKRRLKLHMVLWGVAGLGALLTLPFGITSGREYLGFHPAFSALIWIGWILFAVTFFKKVRPGFWGRPAYVYMWATGILYFLWTFAEGHAYLLPFVREHPVADLQIQWKSCGTLVASFNQMVYGALLFLGERRSGDKRVAQSHAAFTLFGVGLLNSFTNYAHHTYHLPQSELIKWVAFVVSMLEVVFLVRVFHEVTVAMAKRWTPHNNRFRTSSRFIELSRNWNVFLLFLALLISIPPLNALIHGTQVVMAHGMGSELAIDSYILLGVFAYLLAELFSKREVHEEIIDSPGVRRSVGLFNVSLVCLIALLLCAGLADGVTSYLDLPGPRWTASFPYAFVLFGMSAAYSLSRLIVQWSPLFLHPARYRFWEDEPNYIIPAKAPAPKLSEHSVAPPIIAPGARQQSSRDTGPLRSPRKPTARK